MPKDYRVNSIFKENKTMKNVAIPENLYRNKYGIFCTNFTDLQGKRIRRSLKTDDVKLAEIRVKKMIVEAYERGSFDLKRPTKVSFSELADKVLVYAKDKTKRYNSVYRPTVNKLLRHLNGMMLNDIDRNVVDAVLAKIKKEVSEKNANNALTILKRMFNLAIEWGLTRENPARIIKRYRVQPNRPRLLTEEERNKVIESCSGQMKEIVIITFNTGMRKGEILGLKWDNVDLFRKLIILDETKSNKIREIPMLSDVHAILLAKYQTKKPGREDYVFPSPDNKPYTDVKEFRKCMKQAGLKIKFHGLRHDFASRLASKGVPVDTIRELLGHASITTTQIYMHLAPSQKYDAIATLENHPNEPKKPEFKVVPKPLESEVSFGRILAE